MSEASSQSQREVSEIMRTLLAENPNLSDIKEKLRHQTYLIEKHIYHGMIGSEEEYLQVYGLSYH